MWPNYSTSEEQSRQVVHCSRVVPFDGHFVVVDCALKVRRVVAQNSLFVQEAQIGHCVCVPLSRGFFIKTDGLVESLR